MVVADKRPILALEIDIHEVFFHCAKAFLRSDTWDPATWNPTAVPTVAQIAKAIKKDMSMEELEKYYSRRQHAQDPLLAHVLIRRCFAARSAGRRPTEV